MTTRSRMFAGLSAAALLTVPCSTTLLAQIPPAASVEILHVRQLDDGRWIAWTENRTQRTRINIPQSREAITGFAKKNGVSIEWHGDPIKTDATAKGRSDPVPASAPPRPLVTEHATEIPRAAGSPSAIPSGSAAVQVVRQNVPAPVSEAEQVTKLESTIRTSEQRLVELNGIMANPEGEYQKAQSEFNEISSRLELQKAEVARLRDENKPVELLKVEADCAALEKKWALARERFNLAIMTLKTQQEQVTALLDKIRQDQQALDKMIGQKQPPAQETTPAPAETYRNPPALAGAPSATPATSAAVVGSASPPASPNSAPPAVMAAASAMPVTQAVVGETAMTAAASAEKTGIETSAATKEVAKDPKLLQAEQQADLKQEEALEAEREARSVSDRLSSIDKNIDIEQKLFDVARKKSDIAFQQRKALQEEYQAKSIDGTPRAELQELARKMEQAETHFQEARTDVSGHIDRLKELQDERTELQADEIAALTEAQQKATEAATAAGKVSELKNPYSPHNLTQWLLDHGLRMGLIVAVMYALRWLVQLGNRRIVTLMTHGGHGTADEREDRAATLMGVFHNAASVAITIGGGLMICEEAGVPVGTLMGSAAILGLAVAFGAQNLIRDYFYGFVILLENQYKINDVLKIGDISGQVERITLRMTVLRDLEGRVHFIPNGKIDSVTNMTHGWSRAVFEIGVAYKEDVDRVMGVLMELARGLKRDPQYAMLILEEPEMLGVDALGDSAVIIKFVIKTRPLRQWQVKRELLRRIKRSFDELDIEIPFPHRTIYHHVESGSATLPDSACGETMRQEAA